MKHEDMTVEGRYLCTINAGVAAPLVIGREGRGVKRMIPVTDGTVEGRITGRITEGGADWQVMNDNGITDVEARYCLELDGGAVVEVQSAGVRAASPEIIERMFSGEELPPDAYYFRTGMKFRTTHPDYEWLTGFICVGIATRSKDRVVIRVFEIL